MSHGSTNPDFKPTDGQQRQLDMVGTDATHCMAYGGSRSSKTFGWCYILVLRALAYESRHLILRRHYKDARTKQSVRFNKQIVLPRKIAFFAFKIDIK